MSTLKPVWGRPWNPPKGQKTSIPDDVDYDHDTQRWRYITNAPRSITEPSPHSLASTNIPSRILSKQLGNKGVEYE